MNYFAGIDIGSTAIKITVIDENRKLIGQRISGSGSMFYKYAHQTFNDLLNDLNLTKEEIVYTVATGYGRKLFKEADENISEITANAIGAVAAAKAFGEIKTIINIGGQDSKAISLDDQKACDNRCLLDYKKKHKLNFKVLRGDLKILVDYFNTPNIAIPTSIIVNKNGQIVSAHQGYVPGLIENELKKLLQ